MNRPLQGSVVATRSQEIVSPVRLWYHAGLKG